MSSAKDGRMQTRPCTAVHAMLEPKGAANPAASVDRSIDFAARDFASADRAACDRNICSPARARTAPAIAPSAGAVWLTVPQLRQAYLGRRIRTTRNRAGTQSSISLTISPMLCKAQPQPAHVLLARYRTTSSRGQMFRQRPAPGPSIGAQFDGCRRPVIGGFNRGQVGVEVIERDLELIDVRRSGDARIPRAAACEWSQEDARSHRRDARQQPRCRE